MRLRSKCDTVSGEGHKSDGLSDPNDGDARLSGNNKSSKTTRESNQTKHLIKSVVCKVLLIFLSVIYLVVPVVVKVYPSIQSRVVFQTFISWPVFINFSEPQVLDLPLGTRNFYIKSTNDVELGLWHILPTTLCKAGDKPTKYYDHILGDHRPIVLYLHGNSGSRGTWHRIQLYRVLSSLDYHIVAVDYRGFGDSQGTPSTENDIINDAMATFNWIKERSGNSPVLLWGHSLGSGVATSLSQKLCSTSRGPTGVILESPFTNIEDASKAHFLSLPFRILPQALFDWLFIDSIRHCDIYFSNDQNIVHVTSPVLILHAEDDFIVPISLGKKLYAAAQDSYSKTGSTHRVELVTFEGHLGFGHKNIHMSPKLPQIIRNFIKHCEKHPGL